MEDNETEVVEEEIIEEVQISEGDEEPTAPDPLPKEKVAERLGGTNLPKASKARLSEAEYADEDALENAVKAEIAYVKQITKSGEPFGMSGGPREFRPLTEEEKQARYERRLAEVDGGSV